MSDIQERKVYLLTPKGEKIILGDCIKDSITPKDPTWEPPDTIQNLSVSFTMTDDMSKELHKLIEECKQTQMRIVKKVENTVEDMLRTRVKPPIKGKITERKIKWRRLSLIFKEDAFYGILQRDKMFYCIDGNDYPINSYEMINFL